MTKANVPEPEFRTKEDRNDRSLTSICGSTVLDLDVKFRNIMDHITARYQAAYLFTAHLRCFEGIASRMRMFKSIMNVSCDFMERKTDPEILNHDT